MFSQLSQISKIEKEVDKRNSEIVKKYKKKFPDERKSEEIQVGNYRRDEYRKAIENIQKDEVKIDLNTVPRDFTKEAEYETGSIAFRNLFAEYFDTSVIDSASGIFKSEVLFLIDENGTPSNVQAIGSFVDFNQECIITFYKIIHKGKWKPAEKDGVPVKSVYKFPITMQFE